MKPLMQRDISISSQRQFAKYAIKNVSHGLTDERHHDNVIKWKYFSCYWPFVRGIHRSPADSHHKGQWCGALRFCLICTWTNGSANNWDTSDLSCHGIHCDVVVMNFSYGKYIMVKILSQYVVKSKEHSYFLTLIQTISSALLVSPQRTS